MAHERQLLREEIVAQLKGPLNDRTAAGSRVTKSRQEPLTTDQLPAISVYSADETIHESSASTAPRELKRMTRVVIVGWVVASSAVDDALDALALQIETAMDIDHTLDRNASDSILEQTSFEQVLGGERPIGSVALVYSCSFYTQKRVALPTDLFATAGVTTNLGGTQAPADDLEGIVTIP